MSKRLSSAPLAGVDYMTTEEFSISNQSFEGYQSLGALL